MIKLSQKKLLGNVSELAINSAHGLAFHRGLGTPLYPSSSTPLNKYLNEDSIAQFSASAYSKPNIAVVANGASQTDLAKWVGEFFKETSGSAAALTSEATKYYGGEERIAHDSGNSLVVAFPGSSSFTAGTSYKPEIAVLAALLGGKSSIKWSSGFSLLSKAVSAFPGASASTTHFAYSDAGLLTIQFSGSAQAIRDASVEAVKALKSVSEGSISKEDFTKAVALAKYRALEEGQNIESGLVATGSGLIHGGKAFQIDEVGKSVESVTADKLKSVRPRDYQRTLHLVTNLFCRQPRHFWRARLQSRLLEIFMFSHMLRSLVLRYRLLKDFADRGKGWLYQQPRVYCRYKAQIHYVQNVLSSIIIWVFNMFSNVWLLLVLSQQSLKHIETIQSTVKAAFLSSITPEIINISSTVMDTNYSGSINRRAALFPNSHVTFGISRSFPSELCKSEAFNCTQHIRSERYTSPYTLLSHTMAFAWKASGLTYVFILHLSRERFNW